MKNKETEEKLSNVVPLTSHQACERIIHTGWKVQGQSQNIKSKWQTDDSLRLTMLWGLQKYDK